MSNPSDSDPKPPRRPHVQPIDERDGAGVRRVGRRPRTAKLVHDVDPASPVEVHRETTGVQELHEQTDDRLLELGVSAEVRQATSPIVRAIIEVMSSHQKSGERRRMDGDLEVLAQRGGENLGERLTEIAADIVEIHTELDDLRGLRPARTNGKVGTLRGEIKSLRAALIAVALAMLGGSVASAKALYSAGEIRGAERAEFIRLRDTVEIISERQNRRLFGLPPSPAPAGLPGVTP